MQDKKILLTGLCYVHRLLEQRFDTKNGSSHIKRVHPDFNAGNVDFFKENVSERFLFTDFHGKFSSIETEASTLPELLALYEDKCQVMYCVGATQVHDVDIASITNDDFRKVSAFWYFLFDTKWNPRVTEKWQEQRDKVILQLLNRFPTLKFIFYQPQCKKWWEKSNLPSSRMLYWDIDWGMSLDDYNQIKAELEKKGITGGHRFPTEDSYSELCDMILKDIERGI